MTVTQRDKRALILLAAAAAVILLWRAFSGSDKETAVVRAAPSIPAVEKRLLKLREIAATLPAKQEVLDRARKELADRERGIIQADTAAQAQAQLVQILRRIARAQSPAIDIRNVEIAAPRPLGEDYGEVVVGASFDCRIEQLVNFLAAITEQPELISTHDLRIGNAHPKEKSMPVRLTVSGVVRRSLIPDKKGPAL